MSRSSSRQVPLPQPRVRLPRTIARFLHTEASGGIVLLVAATVAVVWANSPWADAYDTLWHTKLSLELGNLKLEEDLLHWVNDALMAVFFFVVGLEIKRELVVGDLRSWRRAALPAIAAIGGMVVPALVYVVVNLGQPGIGGWGVPMATDIAFAVGVLALLGSRVPASLKLFLLTLAIVDDIGAILVIAVFYSKKLDVRWLAVAGVLIAVILLLRRLQVTAIGVYFLVGAGVWLAVFESGVHATIAGVVLGLLAPARPLAAAEVVRDWASDLQDEPSPQETRDMAALAHNTVSVAERLEDLLHPYTSYLIVPLFALANAGVKIDLDAISETGPSRVALGVVAGLVLGKIAGITLAAAAATRFGLGELPADTRLAQVAGVASVAGIGFTVSLFISDLAFTDADLKAAAKIAIFAASLLASVIGAAILLTTGRRRPQAGAPPAVQA